MSKSKVRLVKISKLHFDETVYPRMKVGWMTAYIYAQAMKAGSIFPPIVVGQFKKQMYVVDGWHRVEARKLLKEEYIQAIVRQFESKRDMFVEAVKLNASHGRPLNVQEKVRIIEKLKELRFKPQEITEIIRIPLDKLEKFAARVIRGPNGKLIFLKGILAKAGSKGADEESLLQTDQSSLGAPSITSLLKQLIELLESGVFPIEDEGVMELAVKAYSLMGDFLKITVKVRKR